MGKMREFSKKRYLLALLITSLIFVFGLMLGLVIEGVRISYLEEFNIRQAMDYQSLQLQYQFIDQLGQEKNCGAISKTFDLAVDSLEGARQRLENYNQDATIKSGDFDILKREYTIAQLRYWMLAKKTKDLCNMELSTVLYFYTTEENCPDCNPQAFILTYLKKVFKDRLLNFALDGEYEKEPMIKILREAYEVDEYPTIIIDDTKFGGLTSKDSVLAEICKNYDPRLEECQPQETTEKTVVVN